MAGGREHTLLLVDPYPLLHEPLRSMFTSTGMSVVATVSTRLEALALAAEHRPDAVLMELDLQPVGPDDGLVLLKELLDAAPETHVVVLTGVDDPDYVDAAARLGASGYVLKTGDPAEAVAAVRAAMDGVENAWPRRRGATNAARDTSRIVLTQRELEILRLAADGHTNDEMAKKLWVTEQTVKFHLSNIYRKLGVANRTQASRWAQLHDIVDSYPAF
jgi:DNA-binding NarL/FixJ family response regulator